MRIVTSSSSGWMSVEDGCCVESVVVISWFCVREWVPTSKSPLFC